MLLNVAKQKCYSCSDLQDLHGLQDLHRLIFTDIYFREIRFLLD